MNPIEEGPMKRRLRILLTFVSVLTLVMVMNVGAALAHHENGVWEDCELRSDCGAFAPHWSPVGQNLLADPEFPGRTGLPGGSFDPTEGQAFFNIERNPNCPLHWPES
jgi:hypothetical protein